MSSREPRRGDLFFVAIETSGGSVPPIAHPCVVVQDDVELKGSCPGGQKESAEPGPFQFQNHGDPLVFRNVWVVGKK